MNIYFIRHGETEYNRRGIHQPPDVPLAERGKGQIQQTAKALAALPITKLLTSDLLRTKESAEIIGDEIGLTPEPNALFREVRRPSALFNKHHISLATFATGLGILYHLEDPAWHYSDEENIHDIRNRIEKTVTFLESLRTEHEHVVVVSHALIINLFVKYMCEYERVRRRDYLRSVVAAKLFQNGSITTLTYNDDQNQNTCDWLCTSINRVDHLSK